MQTKIYGKIIWMWYDKIDQKVSIGGELSEMIVAAWLDLLLRCFVGDTIFWRNWCILHWYRDWTSVLLLTFTYWLTLDINTNITPRLIGLRLQVRRQDTGITTDLLDTWDTWSQRSDDDDDDASSFILRQLDTQQELPAFEHADIGAGLDEEASICTRDSESDICSEIKSPNLKLVSQLLLIWHITVHVYLFFVSYCVVRPYRVEPKLDCREARA